MSKQIQEQLQIRLKMLDDVFHNVIIALERLEVFLEKKRSAKIKIEQTAINSDRDLHDDKANPPTEEGFHLELQTQCLALYFQTNFDKDKETFSKIIKYFLTDLLTWYGGREDSVPYNEVEKYFIPIISALNRQVSNQKQISEIIKQYVIDIDSDIRNLSDEHKEKAVIDGFTAFTRASEVTRKSNEGFLKKMFGGGEKPEFTPHIRGTEKAGYERLLRALLNLYNDKTPLLILTNLVKQHLPDLNNVFEEVILEEFYNLKK
jgi:hypothetical protein